jgi:outer membrane protein assembly factor BamB
MFGSEGLYAYNLDGKLLWKQDLGVLDSGFFQAPSAQWGFASSPLLFEDKVILQVDVQKGSFLAAFDAATGRLLWRTERDEVPTWSSPAIAPRGGAAAASWQVVVNGFKHIGGYDLATGEELWKLIGGGDIPVPTPVLARDVPGHGDLLLVTNAHGRMRPSYAIRTDASGEITAEPSGSSSNASTDAGPESGTAGRAIPWWHERLGNYMQTPLVLDGLGYFCFDNGVLTVLDLATGERVYQERLGRGTTGFTASPIAGDGKVYLTSEDGEVYVVAAGRNFELLGTSELGEQSMASPAVVEDRILFRGRSHLVAIGVVPGAGSENEAP